MSASFALMILALLTRSLRQIFPESTVRPTPMRADGAISIAERMKIQAKTARAEAEEAANARVQEIQARARELQASNPV